MKPVGEIISEIGEALSTAPAAARAAVVLGVLGSTAADAATTVGSPTNFDTTAGTKYTPDGGVSCLAGVQPHTLTGGIGVRSDYCADKFEITVNGEDFEDKKPEIEAAIADAGFSIDGTVLASCDYSNTWDKGLVIDGATGQAFLVDGLSTGSVTGVTGLNGLLHSCGYIDESTGVPYAVVDNDGTYEVHELDETADPKPVYAHGSHNIADASLSSTLNAGVFADEDDGYDMKFDADTTDTSASTVSSLGSGAVYGLFEDSETSSGKATVLLSNGSTLQSAEISPDVVEEEPDTGGDDTGEPDTGGDAGEGDSGDTEDSGEDSGEPVDTNDSGDTAEPTETGDSGDTGNVPAEDCTEEGDRYITTDGTYDVGEEICLDDGSAETTGGTADVENGEIILNADGDGVEASGNGLVVQSSDYNDIWTEVNGRAGIDLGGEDQSGTEAARGRSVAPGDPEDEANLNDTPKKPTNVEVYEGTATVHGGNDEWEYIVKAGESASFSDTIDGVAADIEDTGNQDTGEVPTVRHTENDPEGCGCVTASTPLSPEGAVKKGFWAGALGLIAALRRRKKA